MAVRDITKEVQEMREKINAMEHDNINHPKHYNSSSAKCSCGRRIECIDVTRHLNFNIGNAIKYLWRFMFKGGIEDLQKAKWYIEDYIEHLETEKNGD